MSLKYSVKKSEVSQAYRAWCEKVKKTKGQKRDELFIANLKTSLRLLRAVNEPATEVSPLPTTRETWGKWQSSSNYVTLSRELCLVILALTSHDVTQDTYLSDECNFTSLAYIKGTPKGRRVSNEPDESSMEDYEISIERIAFRRSAPMRVIRSDVENGAVAGHIDIGSATLVLREAVLTLIAQGRAEPLATDLAPGGTVAQRAERVSLADDPGCPGRWKVLPDGDILEGSVYLPRLALAKSREDGEILVTVTAEEAAIDADFRATGELLEKDANKAKARASLMNKVLALDISEHRGSCAYHGR
jgi:hypothetical protein